MKAFEITNITLENIKTYISEEINFSKGNNVLIGENGAGKSTILESIYLSIFGDTVPGRNLVDMIRFGERQGRITVKFSVDGINYRVEDEITKKEENRAIQTQILYNETNEETIAEGRTAVKVKIEEILGIDSTTFISAVYASQGEIANIVTAKEMDRKRLFDRLFQIDRYEKAWQNLAKVEKLVKQQIENNQNKLELIQQDIIKLPVLKNRLFEKEELLKQGNKEISQLTKKFTQIDDLYKKKKNLMIEYTKLSTLKESLEKELRELEKVFQKSFQDLKLKAGEENLEANTGSLNIFRNKWDQKLIKYKQTLTNSKETEKSILLMLEKIKSLKTNIMQHQNSIENREKQINEEITQYLEYLPDLGNNPAIWSDKLKSIGEEKQVKLKELLIRQKSLEKSNQELTSKREKLLEKETSLNKITQKYVQKRLTLANIAGENWHEVAAELEIIDFAKLIEDLSSLKEKQEEEQFNLNSTKSVLETTIERVRGDLDHLEVIQGEETCPTCKQKLSSTLLRKLKEDLLKEKETNSKARNEVSQKLSTLNKEINDIKRKISKLQEQQALFQKISPSLNDLPELESDKNLLEKELEELNKKIRELELKNAKENYEELCQETSSLEQLLIEIKNIKNALPRLIETKAQIEEDKKKIKTMENERNKLEKDNTEQKLQEIKQKVTILEGETQELQELISNNKLLVKDNEKIEKKQIVFENSNLKIKELETVEDLKNFMEIENDWRALNEKIISKKSDIKNLKEEIIPPLKTQINDLLQKENQQKQLCDALELEKQKEKIVVILRSLMRDLPNKLLPNYIDKINHTATDILHSILPESDIQGIELNSDYSLNIIRHGNIEDISILSGGETIIVALALRLAFAKEFSTLDTLILDEPTIFLDERRRGELVSVLEKNRLVGQMFVVTHDPDFERISDQTFIVNKNRSETNINSIDPESGVENDTKLDLSL